MEHSHEHTHTYTHSHGHDHADGEEQIHEHQHEHVHDHSHEHAHTHVDENGNVYTHTHSHDESEKVMTDIEKTRALLGYMIDHNEHHAEELADMLPALEGEAQKKLSEAIGCFEAGNVQLREVLELL